MLSPEQLEYEIRELSDRFRRHVHDGIETEELSFSPGGSDTQIQFNDNGEFGADLEFTYDKDNNQLNVENIQTETIFAPDDDTGTGTGTDLNISAGTGGGTSGDGGALNIFSGSTSSGQGGALVVKVPASVSDDGSPLTLFSGKGDGSGKLGGDIQQTIPLGSNGAAIGRLVFYDNANTASQRFIGTVATTNATPATFNIPIRSGQQSVTIEAHVIARRGSGAAGSADDSAAYVRRATYKTISTTPTLVGAIQDNYTVEDQAGWDCTFTVSGTDIQLQVTGAVDNNITWKFEIWFMGTKSGIL